MTNHCEVLAMLLSDHMRALRAGKAREILTAAKAIEEHKRGCPVCSPALQLWPGAKVGKNQ